MIAGWISRARSGRGPRQRARAIAAALAAGLLVGLACDAPTPDEPNRGEGVATDRAVVPPAQAEAPVPPPPRDRDGLAQEPLFTPFTTAPRVADRLEAVASLRRHYPRQLENAGIGGTTILWVFIDADGRVKNTRVQRSSGHPALDRAAQAAVMEFEFTAARNRGTPVPVWIALPITFKPRPRQEDPVSRLRGALRMIATVQEEHYSKSGRYHSTLDAEALRSVVPKDVEVVSFVAHEDGWAAVLRRGERECAMYYGRIEAPRPYARVGRAICQ